MPKSKNNFTIKKPFYSSPRCYKNFAFGLFSFLCAYLVASILTPVKLSDAQEIQYDINESTGFYVRVTGSATLSVEDVTSTALGQLASVKDTINVETNSPFGYRLLFSAASANLTNTENSNFKFTPTSGTLSTPVSLTKDTWGFAFDKTNTGVVANNFADASKYTSASTPSVPDQTATWAAVPTTPTQISSIDDANVNTDGTNLDIFYGINASTSLPSGTYATTITYTAYSEGANDKMPTMQDFTQAQCDTLTTDVPVKLIDTRDLKTYSVTKLRDGNCWMTSNLALDGGRTLTPSDSNVVTNHTLPANITDGTASAYDTPQIYSGVANDTTTNCGSYEYCVVSDVKYGNLYNWNAATATVGLQTTTGTVYESVCPKGWRMPDNTGDKSFTSLLSAYNITGVNQKNGDAVETLQQAPLNFSLTGEYYGTNITAQGHTGYYLTRTGNSSNNNYYLMSINSESGNLYQQNSSGVKNTGKVVRCVYGEDSTNLMQNFTASMCNALTVSTASTPVKKVLMDSRDGKLYNISRLADNPSGESNGICWMVSNLALDGTDSQGTVRTLTPSDSNVTTNTTLAPNISTSTTSNDTEVQIYSGIANDYTTSEEASAYPYAVANDTPYGNLYNWFAATAKSGTASLTTEAPYSLCPKGWRLPTNGNNTTNKSYSKLVYSIGDMGNGGYATNGTYVQNAQKAPLYITLSGGYIDSVYYKGSVGYYTTNSAYDDTYNYNFSIFATDGNFLPPHHNYKKNAMSLRCVLNS